eukprot:sb/3469357/
MLGELLFNQYVTKQKINNRGVLLTHSEYRNKTQGLFLSSAKTQNAQKANLYYLQQTCPILIRSTLTLIPTVQNYSDMFFKGLFSKGRDQPDQAHGSSEQHGSPSKKPGFQLFRSVRKAYNKMKKGGNNRPSSSPMPKILEGLDEDLEPAAVVIDVRKGRTRGPQGRKRLSHRPFSTVSLDIDLVAQCKEEGEEKEIEVSKPISPDNELSVDNSDGARAVAPSGGDSGGKDSD